MSSAGRSQPTLRPAFGISPRGEGRLSSARQALEREQSCNGAVAWRLATTARPALPAGPLRRSGRERACWARAIEQQRPGLALAATGTTAPPCSVGSGPPTGFTGT